jgi:hypothetical protein
MCDSSVVALGGEEALAWILHHMQNPPRPDRLKETISAAEIPLLANAICICQ